KTTWRQPLSSINYIETSTLWRQEHNGYSHQDPTFINALINMKSRLVRIYFPPDSPSTVAVMDRCLKTKGCINLVVASKQNTPAWGSWEEARKASESGIAIWKWASTDGGRNPDVVMAGCGTEVMFE
ncbi:hypothetical protein HDU93_004894, partial [Gonapodya sp. JEL0774]